MNQDEIEYRLNELQRKVDADYLMKRVSKIMNEGNNLSCEIVGKNIEKKIKKNEF